MKRIQIIFLSLFAFVLLFATACAAPSYPEEISAEEYANTTPEFSELSTNIHPSSIPECNDLWINKTNKASYAGFTYLTEKITTNPESSSITWRAYLTEIAIEEKTVDIATRHVAVCTIVGGEKVCSQVTGTEDILEYADKLAASAPDVYITIDYAWEPYPNDPNYYSWQVKKKTCTTEKPGPK